MSPTATANNGSVKFKPHGLVTLIEYLVIAFVLPPVGIALGIYLLAKDDKRFKTILTNILILLVALAGIPMYFNIFYNHKNQQNDYSYNLGTLQEATSSSSSALSFKKPSEFKQTSRLEKDDTTTTIYSHVNSGGYTIGLIGLSDNKSNLAADAKYLKGIRFLMSQPQGEEYDKFTGYFKDFIKSFNSKDYTITLGYPVKFTNEKIKDDAWVFDINGVTKGTEKLSPLKGEFIYIVGNKGFYYLAITNTESNWNDNKDIWRQVTDSIKISQ